MIDRRSFLIATATTLVPRFAEAHEGIRTHTHPHPAQGTNGCIPGPEHSFDRGQLENYFKMPGCVHIIHRAAAPVPPEQPEFSILALGRSVFAIWVHEDVPIDGVTSKQLIDLLTGREPFFSIETGDSTLVVNYRHLPASALQSALKPFGMNSSISGKYRRVWTYSKMRQIFDQDHNATLIGYRDGSYKGMKALLLDGKHPYHDHSTYPLYYNAWSYTRNSSSDALPREKVFLSLMDERRDIDSKNLVARFGLI